MKNHYQSIKNLIVVIAIFFFANTSWAHTVENQLWYQQPASKWIESLPVGNGRLGAVVFGGVEQETIGLNISTLWSGEPSTKNVKNTGLDHLDRILNLYFNHESAKAEQLIKEHLLGNKLNYGTHLPMGDLLINFYDQKGKPTGYTRNLNLENAVASVNYKINGIDYQREVLVSHPDDVLIIRFKTQGDKKLAAKLHFKSKGIPYKTYKENSNIFAIEGDAFEKKHSDGKTGVHFYTGIEMTQCDGRIHINDEGIEFSGASVVELRICGYTSYKHNDPKARTLKQLTKLNSAKYDDIKSRHSNDYAELYQRNGLNLGNVAIKKPTDIRIQEMQKPGDDPGLYALFYNYARYRWNLDCLPSVASLSIYARQRISKRTSISGVETGRSIFRSVFG